MKFHLLRKTRGAFTLIEVVVALALFGVAVVVLSAAYVDVLNNVERVRVDQALEDELALVRSQVLLQPDLKKVEAGGDVPTVNYGDATWSAEVTPSKLVGDLFTVDLEVSIEAKDSSGKTQKIHETLNLLRPDWSEPTDRDAIRAERKKALTALQNGRPL